MIYAVGDIHGELDLLEGLLGQIKSDARTAPGGPHKIIFIGDYVDRGESSRQVLDLVRKGVDGFEVICLRGNHEQAMLEVCANRDLSVAKVWLSNTIGGIETLESYGLDRREIKAAMKKPDDFWPLLAAVDTDHLDFIRSMPLTHEEDGYLFVHAGIRPGIALEAQREDDLLWIRKDFTLSRHDHGCIVVHGHTWRRRPQKRKNRIGIDTGAYTTGRLTAAVLDGEKKPRFLCEKRKH